MLDLFLVATLFIIQYTGESVEDLVNNDRDVCIAIMYGDFLQRYITDREFLSFMAIMCRCQHGHYVQMSALFQSR